MSKELKDYLNLYLPEVMVWCEWDSEIRECKFSNIETLLGSKIGVIKPVLRKLSSMTEEEMLAFVRIDRPLAEKIELKDGYLSSFHDPKDGTFYKWQFHPLHQCSAKQFIYLLSKGFDLFDLIDDGLAIDKESLNQ